MLLKYRPQSWLLCYDNSGDSGSPPAAAPPAAPPSAPPAAEGGAGAAGGEGDKPKEKKFSQDKVNKLLAEEKRKGEAKIAKTVKELEELKKNKELSERARDELQLKIDELNNSLLTKEQLAEKEKKRIQDEAKTKEAGLTKERDEWKGLFHSTQIQNTLLSEATKQEAYNPDVLVRLLAPITRLEPTRDKEGNPVPGKYTPKVALPDTDKDGNPITLDLTVSEAVKWMKDKPEYANQFKSGVAGGLGQTGGRSGKQFDINTATPDEYRKWRASQPWAPKRGPK